MVELDPQENQSTLKSVKEDIESFVSEHQLGIKHFGREEALAILREEISEEILPDNFEEEVFASLYLISSDNPDLKSEIESYASSLSFKKGIALSRIDYESGRSPIESSPRHWIYLIAVVVGILIYILLSKLSIHNRLQLKKRELYSINFIGGNIKKWSLGIKKSALMQNLKLLFLSLILSVVIYALVHFEYSFWSQEVIVPLLIGGVILYILLFGITQWILHSELKRLIP